MNPGRAESAVESGDWRRGDGRMGQPGGEATEPMRSADGRDREVRRMPKMGKDRKSGREDARAPGDAGGLGGDEDYDWIKYLGEGRTSSASSPGPSAPSVQPASRGAAQTAARPATLPTRSRADSGFARGRRPERNQARTEQAGRTPPPAGSEADPVTLPPAAYGRGRSTRPPPGYGDGPSTRPPADDRVGRSARQADDYDGRAPLPPARRDDLRQPPPRYGAAGTASPRARS